MEENKVDSNLKKRFKGGNDNIDKNEIENNEGNGRDTSERPGRGSDSVGTLFGIGAYGINDGNTVNKVVKDIKEIISNTDNKGYVIFGFDGPTFNFDASFFSISKKCEATKSVYNYIFLLRATGPKALTGTEFLSRSEDKRAYPYTVDALLDNDTIAAVNDEVSAKYPDSEFIISGTTIVHLDAVELARDIANIAIRKIEMDIDIALNGDLNVLDSFKSISDANIEMQYTPIPEGQVETALQVPVKADFAITIGITPNYTRGSRSAGNKGNGSAELAKVFGYIDYVLEEETVRGRGRNSSETQLKFRPHVIITDMRIYRDTFNYGMIGLLAATIFQDENLIYKHLHNKREDLAQLTYLINPQNEAKMTVPNLENTTDEVINDLIYTLGVDGLHPMYSIDIENNGTMQYLAPLVDAAYEKKYEAITDSLMYFTGDNLNYEGDIAVSAHDMPRGIYYAQGDVDCRNLTIPEICKVSRNVDDVYFMNTANLGEGKDIFVNTLAVYVDCVNDLSVDGTFTRIGIDPGFLDAVLDATKMSEYVVTESPDVSGFGGRRTRNFGSYNGRVLNDRKGYGSGNGTGRGRRSYSARRR